MKKEVARKWISPFTSIVVLFSHSFISFHYTISACFELFVIFNSFWLCNICVHTGVIYYFLLHFLGFLLDHLYCVGAQFLVPSTSGLIKIWFGYILHNVKRSTILLSLFYYMSIFIIKNCLRGHQSSDITDRNRRQVI